MTSKTLCGISIAMVVAFFAGAGMMYCWNRHQMRLLQDTLPQPIDSESIPRADFTQETVALPDIQEVNEEEAPVISTTPSHLSKIELSDIQQIVTRSGAELKPKKTVDMENQIILPDGAETISLVGSVKKSEGVVASDSKISMIDAPVKALLINSLEEYREFKRRARGSYPQADFNKQQVLVLESISNLPDKVFEIISVKNEKDKRIVTYRVSVFGLEEKTNTHSALLIKKSNLPLELKQVL